MVVAVILWDRVAANLRAAGMTQAAIARACGVSKRAVETWHCGEKGPTHYRTVIRVLDLHYDHCPERHRVEVIGRP